MMRRFVLLLALLGASAQGLRVQATAYTLRGITADGSRARNGVIAVSRNLRHLYPYGSTVRLVGVKGPSCGGFATGQLRVADTMARGIYNTVDVWLPTQRAADNWGRCTAKLVLIKKARP